MTRKSLNNPATTALDVASPTDLAAKASVADLTLGTSRSATVSPWRASPKVGPERWAAANMQAGYTALSLTSTASSTSINLESRCGNLGPCDGRTWRLEFDYSSTVPSGSYVVQYAMLTDGQVPIGAYQVVVTGSSPLLSGHHSIDIQIYNSTNQILSIKTSLYNNTPSGTLSVTNVTLRQVLSVTRPLLVAQQYAGASYPYIYQQQQNPVTGVWQVAARTFADDGLLTNGITQSYGYISDNPWRNGASNDSTLARATLSPSIAVGSQEESTTGTQQLHIKNNDHIYSWYKNDGVTTELAGNTHGKEVNSSPATWFIDQGSGLVSWPLTKGLAPAQRFQMVWPTALTRSEDATPTITSTHTTTIFRDGVSRTDRVDTFVKAVTLNGTFEWMTSFDTTTPVFGKVGNALLTVAGTTDTHPKVPTPATPTATTTTTGGTLIPATYSYRVSATSTEGESLPSTGVTSVVPAVLATPVNAAFSNATTGGTLTAATYYYRVSATNALGETLASTETSIVVPATTATNTVTVNWGAVTGATGYRVYGRTTAGELFIAAVGAVTTYADTGSVTPAGALPAANTTFTTTNTNTVTLTIADPGSATGYRIYGRTTGVERLIATIPSAGASTTWTDTGALLPLGALPTVSTSRLYNGTLATSRAESSVASWAVFREPRTGWCYGVIFDRDAVAARPEVDQVDTAAGATPGIQKMYNVLTWAGGAASRAVPVGTVWAATHFSFIYLPADTVNFHQEIATRAANLSTLKSLYPAT